MKLEVTQTSNSIERNIYFEATGFNVDGIVLEITHETMADYVIMDWIAQHCKDIEIRMGDLKWKSTLS